MLFKAGDIVFRWPKSIHEIRRFANFFVLISHIQRKDVFFKVAGFSDMISLQHHVEDDVFSLKSPALCVKRR
ncbi:hypothetical protein CHT97_01390 [Lacticaseibacillus chiayiensis]|nr:hypothetical protein CHT97_01390 [Lacticaseibacillus chiayiensis]